MGIAHYQLANACRLIIAQRLVRLLCPHCKKPDLQHQPVLQQQLNTPIESPIYQAVGCDQCHQGYTGSIGIFEVLPVSNAMQHAILQQKSATDIHQLAVQAGMSSLRQSALQQVCLGQTSLQEADRMTTIEAAIS